MPDELPPPGETLLETMAALGVSQADLALRIGLSKQTVNRIAKGLEPITPKTALQFERALGIPAGFWNRLERNYREAEARRKERDALRTQLDWLKTVPVRAMVKAGWIAEHSDRIEQAREVLQFFGVVSPQQWEAYYLGSAVRFRRSRVYTDNPAATAAWLRKGELEAREIDCAPFDKAGFSAALAEMRGLTREIPEAFTPRLRQRCASVGVAVAFVPPLAGTSACGATQWLTRDKALIQLSLRYKWEDVLWFTFYHEAGHILKHGKMEVFLESRMKSEQCDDESEAEADRFAADTLVPSRKFRDFVAQGRYRDKAAVRRFADRIGVCPAIVVGRLQHEGLLPRNWLNDMRRRFDFPKGAPRRNND